MGNIFIATRSSEVEASGKSRGRASSTSEEGTKGHSTQGRKKRGQSPLVSDSPVLLKKLKKGGKGMDATVETYSTLD